MRQDEFGEPGSGYIMRGFFTKLKGVDFILHNPIHVLKCGEKCESSETGEKMRGDGGLNSRGSSRDGVKWKHFRLMFE